MRILHVVYSLDPANGGPPRVAARMAAAQAALGHDVTILCYGSPERQAVVEEMTAAVPGFSNVCLITVNASGLIERLTARAAREQMQKVMDNVDIVHIYDFWMPMLGIAAFEARKRKIPYYFQPNGCLDIWPLQQKRLKKQLAMSLFFRGLLNDAAGLGLGNDAEWQAVKLLNLRTPHTILPLNGLFPEEVSVLPPAGSFHKRFPQLGGKPFILFLGRLHYKKGLDYLAEAFSAFAKVNSEVQLVVVGHDEGAQPDFEARIAKHGVQDRVHLVGPLHGEAKWEAFKDASCFALPSRQEGFSIAITEALACGLPVVISKGCHFLEVAEVEAGRIVDLDTDAVVEAFKYVFADEERWKAMSKAAQALVAERYSHPGIAQRLVEFYEKAVNKEGNHAYNR